MTHLFQWLQLDLASVVHCHLCKGQSKTLSYALARPRPWQMLPLYFFKEAVTYIDGTQQPTVILTATAACVGVLSVFSTFLSFEGVNVKTLAMRKGVS